MLVSSKYGRADMVSEARDDPRGLAAGVRDVKPELLEHECVDTVGGHVIKGDLRGRPCHDRPVMTKVGKRRPRGRRLDRAVLQQA